MGWQDRDWARWTDDERRRYVGGGGGGTALVPGAFVAVVVSLLGFVVFARPGGVSIFHLGRAHARSVVYGTGAQVVGAGGAMLTCTAVERVEGGVRCLEWTALGPGRRPAVAAPLGSPGDCLIARADQTSGRWVCTVARGVSS